MCRHYFILLNVSTSVILITDKFKRTARYVQDGTLSMDFSSETTVSHEFSDKLPTAEYQVVERRVVHLPGNMTHTTEWWHQIRQDGSHTPATRGATSAGDKLVRRLKVINVSVIMPTLSVL